jgi:nucleoid DNA-binding protein
MAKATGGKKPMTKSQVMSELAEATGMKKTEMVKVLDAVVGVIHAQLGKKGAGIVTIPGLARFKARPVKAVKGGEKKINPLTGGEYVTKDKPAYTKVTVSAVKALKDALK